VEFTARDRLRLLLGAGAAGLAACGGGSDSGFNFGSGESGPPPPLPPNPPNSGNTGLTTGLLRDSFRNNFSVGTALTGPSIDANDLSTQIALDQFSSITPEYELKPETIQPEPGVFNFDLGDRSVDWALENGMEVRGHALVWHESMPAHFAQGTRADIRARLEDYVSTVVDHFRGRVDVWDVVNEVISVDIYDGSNGIGPDRRTPWFEAVGNADYIDWAFHAARAANPDALLFLSDYDTENPIKRGWMVEILQRLASRSVPIDGVGHQFHLYLETDPAEALAAIDAVDNQFMGLINHATEVDVNFYSDPGSCWQSGTNCIADIGATAPADMLATQARLIRDLLDGLALRSTMESVTFWGVRDSDSWLNESPAVRSNFPLLFDRDGEPKPVFHAITDPNYEI